MEAARFVPVPRVELRGTRLFVDGLYVDDEHTVALVAAREAAGEDPAAVVADAIEIGARILDREQASANADFVRAEFERAAHELDREFGERAAGIAERLDGALADVFSPDGGRLEQLLAQHFGDDSTGAVQNRVKTIVEEAMTRSREDLVRRFSSGDAANPLADFKEMAREQLRQGAQRQEQQLEAMRERLQAVNEQLVRLQAERDAQQPLAAERERGTAKGRTYEAEVFGVLDALAAARGDSCEAVGDVPGAGGKKGDVVVGIGACSGPARGRIVFEAKDSKLSRNEALATLEESLAVRDADYAVLVVASAEKLPARTHQLRELAGDKLIVVYDPADPDPLALELAYGLATARVMMSGEEADGLDAAALRVECERALHALEEVRRVKSQLTSATNSIGKAAEIVDSFSETVRAHLSAIETMVR